MSGALPLRWGLIGSWVFITLGVFAVTTIGWGIAGGLAMSDPVNATLSFLALSLFLVPTVLLAGLFGGIAVSLIYPLYLQRRPLSIVIGVAVHGLVVAGTTHVLTHPEPSGLAVIIVVFTPVMTGLMVWEFRQEQRCQIVAA